MSQTKRNSLIESIVNTAIGFTVTLLFSPLIYWVCNVKISGTQQLSATVLFTILSVIRGYLIRRYFNKKVIQSNHKNLEK